MEDRRPKRSSRKLAARLVAGIWLLVTAMAPLFQMDHVEAMGPASAGPIVAAAPAGGGQEGIEIYTVAIIHDPDRVTHPYESAFGEAIVEELQREGIHGRLETPQGFLNKVRGGQSSYQAAVVSPWLVASPDLRQGLASFAKLGGDLVLLGDAGISLARIDEGIGLPIFSPHEPYELYELKDVVGLEPTEAFEELGFGPGVDQGHAVDQGYVGEIRGHSAVGYMYPNASQYWPLLAANDEHGRVRGWAAGALVHYAGPYARGHWLISGVTAPSFYVDPSFARLTARALALFRSGELMERALSENKARHLARKLFEADTPAPEGGLRVSQDGVRLVTTTGETFFMIGANYAGPFGHGFGFGSIDVEAIEADFRKAKWAGINSFRLWSAADADPKLKSVLSEMARKYGIYLMIVLPHPSEMAADYTYLARVKRIVETWADEPMVIGYDLANEPDIQRIGGIRYGGDPTAVLALKPFESFQHLLDRRQIEEEVRSNAYPGNPRYTRHEENLHLRAARDLWLGLVTGPLTRRGRDYSTFPGFTGSLEVPASLGPLHDAVEDTFAQWIGRLAETIREIAPHQLVTVGYDQPYALLAANEALDFVNHHVYQRPNAFAEVEKNLTTMDRLRLRWPNKPVSYGEFGYSSGYPMPDGRMLDPYTAAVGEIMFYLDGFAKGYSGAMIWLLNERPIANMRHNELWMQAPDLRYEERLGVFYYDGDGTFRGKPKPIAHALRFFAEWAEGREPGEGEFLLRRSGTRIGAGYVFQAQDALFVGDVEYDSPALGFRSQKGVNVMLRWSHERLEIMATADVTVRLDPSQLEAELADEVVGIQGVDVEGKHGGIQSKDRALLIDLLEGETVTLRI